MVTHGTNVMAFSCCAVSFALQGVGKPIVFTGCQIPGNEIGSDAKRNWVNAVKTACSQNIGN